MENPVSIVVFGDLPMLYLLGPSEKAGYHHGHEPFPDDETVRRRQGRQRRCHPFFPHGDFYELFHDDAKTAPAF